MYFICAESLVHEKVLGPYSEDLLHAHLSNSVDVELIILSVMIFEEVLLAADLV
jgi:hypothetical protein